MSDQRSLVTVVGTRKRVDVALPALAPVGEYAAHLAELCGQDTHDVFPPAWSLTRAGGAPLALEQSLADGGVVDGAVLHLVDIAGDPGGEPAIDDIEELVADETADLRQRETPRGLAVIGLGLLWMCAAALLLPFLGKGVAGGISLTVAALVLLGISWMVRQRRTAVPPALGLAISLTAALCMTSAGALLGGAFETPGAAWAGAVIGANVGVVIALEVTPEIILFAIEVQLLVAVLLINLFWFVKVDRAQAAAAVAVAAVALLGASKWLAATVSAWAAKPPKRNGPMANAVTALLIQARRVLTVVIVIPVAALCFALPVLTLYGGWFGFVLTVVASVGLLVRCKQAGFRSEVVTFGAGGFVGLFAALGVIAYRFTGRDGAVALLLLGGFGVLAVGMTLTLVQLPLTESAHSVSLAGAAAPGRRTAAEVIGLLCNLAVAPMAMGVFGVYSELSAMGLDLVS